MALAHDRLCEIIGEAGYDPEPYSGRGMHGARCVALTTDDGEREAMAALVDSCEDVEEAANLIRTMSSDGMGLGRVLYWRRVAWPEADAA